MSDISAAAPSVQPRQVGTAPTASTLSRGQGGPKVQWEMQGCRIMRRLEDDRAQGPQRPPVGGNTFLTNMKMAFSGDTFILLRMTYTNWPTVRSAGTRYLRKWHGTLVTAIRCRQFCTMRNAQTARTRRNPRQQAPEGTATHFFLSMSGMSLFCAFSTMTCSAHPHCDASLA